MNSIFLMSFMRKYKSPIKAIQSGSKEYNALTGLWDAVISHVYEIHRNIISSILKI